MPTVGKRYEQKLYMNYTLILFYLLSPEAELDFLKESRREKRGQEPGREPWVVITKNRRTWSIYSQHTQPVHFKHWQGGTSLKDPQQDHGRTGKSGASRDMTFGDKTQRNKMKRSTQETLTSLMLPRTKIPKPWFLASSSQQFSNCSLD